MGRRLVLLLLIVLVGVLWWFRTRQIEEIQEDQGAVAVASVLFPGVLEGNVKKLGVDNLERAVDVRLQRNAENVWHVTDPIAARASQSLVGSLVTELTNGSGRLAPKLDLSEAGLDPPRAVVTFEEAVPSGWRKGRLEIGSVDVEGKYVYVRIPDHPDGRREDGSALLLGSRSWETLVTHDRDAWRDPVLFAEATGALKRIRRMGQVQVEGDGLFGTNQSLTIEVDGQGEWRVVEPVSMKADDTVAQTLIRGLLKLKAHRFVANDAETKARFELENAALRFELEWFDGTVRTLELDVPKRGDDVPSADANWVASLVDEDVVIALPPRSVPPITLPPEVFYDQQFLRLLRTDVATIELSDGDESLSFRATAGRWTVDDGKGEGALPASASRMEDLLAVLERVTIASFPGGATLGDGAKRELRVTTFGGMVFEGVLGGPLNDDSIGASGLAFRRVGDELVGLVSAELGELFPLDVTEYRRRILWKVPESQASQISIERGARQLLYWRDGTRWVPRGANHQADVMPDAFYPLAERLLLPKVTGWLDAEPDELARRTALSLKERDGNVRELEIGFDAEGQVVGRAKTGSWFVLDESFGRSLDELFQ